MLERVRSEHEQELDFPLLSGPGSRVIGRYGLLNPDGRGRLAKVGLHQAGADPERAV